MNIACIIFAEQMLLNLPEIIDQKENVIQAYSSLEDETSRDTFRLILERYMTGNPVEIPCYPFSEQYAPSDISLTKQISHYVCCGAYDGDSIIKLTKKYGRLEQAFAFEPDQKNFKALSNTILNSGKRYGDTITCPCRTYSTTTQLKFACNNGLSSTLDDEDALIQQH